MVTFLLMALIAVTFTVFVGIIWAAADNVVNRVFGRFDD